VQCDKIRKKKNGYTWWWIIIAETCCVYVTSEQNKNNKFVARRTEVNCLIISEFFTCSWMLKYNIMRLQIIHFLTSESVTVTYFLCYSIQLLFQQISREGVRYGVHSLSFLWWTPRIHWSLVDLQLLRVDTQMAMSERKQILDMFIMKLKKQIIMLTETCVPGKFWK
jgi:hypothetical protein